MYAITKKLWLKVVLQFSKLSAIERGSTEYWERQEYLTDETDGINNN